MPFTISVSKACEDEIRKIFLWYETQKENLGFEFESHFSKAIESIKSNPLKIQVRYGNIRYFF